MKEFIQEILEWVQAQGAWAPLLFILVYVATTLAFVPASVMTIAAGAIFGVVKGIILVSFASTLTVAISFILSRFFLRKWVEEKVKHNPKFKAIDEAVAREGWKMVALMRLTPVFPFSLLNYALGLTGISFWQATIASWVGMLPATILYVYLGSIAKVATGETSINQKISYGVGLLAAVIVIFWITRVAKKSMSSKIASEEKTER